MSRGQIVLGKVQGGTFFNSSETLSEAELNHHVHVVGPTGYGKTVLLTHIVKHQIESGRGLLFLDLKGELETILKFSGFAANASRAEDLQIFSLTDLKMSWGYNPLSGESATQIRDKIMNSLEWSEEYYKNQSASFLLKLLIGLKALEAQSAARITIPLVYECTKSKEKIASLLRQVGACSLQEKSCLEEAYQFLSEPENYRSLQGLRVQLESLMFSDFGEIISGQRENEINFFESARKSKINMIFLDSRRYPATARVIGKFLLQDLKSASARIDAEVPRNERRPYCVIIDEFSDFADEDFVGFLDRARSSKMSIVLSHQDFSDLKRVSPEFAARVMANTSTTYAFMQKMPESAELIARMAGTREVWKETLRANRIGFWDISTGEKSLRQTEEFLVHPNQIRSLRVGECVSIKKYPKTRVRLVKVMLERR